MTDLYFSHTDEKPIDYDFGTGYAEDWDYWETEICDECGLSSLAHGEELCPHCEENDKESWINAEGPMMNYYYPIELRHDHVQAAHLIANLPLCIIEIQLRSDYNNTITALALTGGGMDLSWEICQAYVALGYIPPLHFFPPPKMATRYGKEHAEVLNAFEKALDAKEQRIECNKKSLEDMRKYIAERP